MKVRIGAAQPLSFRGKEEHRNVETCLRFIRQAAEAGAQIVCFPEGFPGPWLHLEEYPSLEAIQDQARTSGIYVIAGMAEAVAGKEDHFYTTMYLIKPDGSIQGKYRRVQPPTQGMASGLTPGRKRAFGKDAPEELPVFETPLGHLGILCCSEVYIPELCRVLALKGADIVFLPVGGVLYELFDTWKTLLWARAIENLTYTVACQHLFGKERGIARIAGPEEVLGELEGEGLLVCDVDLSRLTWLRDQDQALVLPKPYKVVPGLLRWRRPKLYGAIVEEG